MELRQISWRQLERDHVAVVVASGRVAGEAVNLLFSIGTHALVDGADERLLGVIHAFNVMAAAAGGEVAVNHLLMNGSSHFRTLFDLLFRGAHRAADFTEERLRASDGLVDQEGGVVDRTDKMIRFILQVAVRAASRHAGSRTEVIALLIGGISDVHRMIEFAAELFRASSARRS